VKAVRYLQYIPSQLDEGGYVTGPFWRLSVRVDQSPGESHPKRPFLLEAFFDGATLGKFSYVRALTRAELPLYPAVSMEDIDALSEAYAGSKKGYYKVRAGCGATEEDSLHSYYTSYDLAKKAYQAAGAILSTYSVPEDAGGATSTVGISPYGRVPSREGESWSMYPLDTLPFVGTGGRGEYAFSLVLTAPVIAASPGSLVVLAGTATQHYQRGDYFIRNGQGLTVASINPVTGEFRAYSPFDGDITISVTDGITVAYQAIRVVAPSVVGSSQMVEQ